MPQKTKAQLLSEISARIDITGAKGTSGPDMRSVTTDIVDSVVLLSGTYVQTINGSSGAVTLDAADVGAAATSHSHTVSDISDAGSAASKNAGTSAGQVLLLSANNKLPALDGSALTSLSLSFLGLSDTVGSYGLPGEAVIINDTGDGLEFGTASVVSVSVTSLEEYTESGLGSDGQVLMMLDPAVSPDTVAFRSLPAEFMFAAGDETTVIEVGTDKVAVHLPYGIELHEGSDGIRASVTTPTGSSGLLVAVKADGTNLITGGLEIEPGADLSDASSPSPVINQRQLPKGTRVTVDVLSADGESTGLKIALMGVRL